MSHPHVLARQALTAKIITTGGGQHPGALLELWWLLLLPTLPNSAFNPHSFALILWGPMLFSLPAERPIREAPLLPLLPPGLAVGGCSSVAQHSCSYPSPWLGPSLSGSHTPLSRSSSPPLPADFICLT